ncbi:FCD domain-containing protein [Streptomyces sp. LN590]|uniref:FCD domain-containing protein n=1 Tax=unclassified Streptomyces TaxID=2593676 RepID=UPI00371296C4
MGRRAALHVRDHLSTGGSGLSSSPDAAEPAFAEHERIVRAVLRRSPYRAREAMEAHLPSSFDRRRGQHPEG